MDSSVQSYPDLESLSLATAGHLRQAALDAVARRGAFYVAVSGGKTPQRLYEWLGEEGAGFPWEKTWLFLVDERAVPFEHPDSNYGQLRRAWRDRPPLPEDHLFPFSVEGDLEAAARAYEETLRRVIPEEGGAHRLDVILLGLGADGHTASLFPGHALLQETHRLVAAVPEPAGQPAWPRLTLTFPQINDSREAVFMVSGAGKQPVVRAILHDPSGEGGRYPAARVRTAGRVRWMLDFPLEGERA